MRSIRLQFVRFALAFGIVAGACTVASGGAASPNPGNRWPTLVVPFYLGGLPSPDDGIVRAAILDLETQGPLDFQESTTPPASGRYISYILDPSASVTKPNEGHPGATIHLRIGVYAADTVKHETLHALGMIHEATRPDRDQYVHFECACYNLGCDANGDPIPLPGGENPFGIRQNALVWTPYDFYSIMHYSSFQFSNDFPGPGSDPGCPVLTVLADGSLIPTSADLTPEDRNTLCQLYEPTLGAPAADDALGAAMVAADFDGDGYDDLAVGAPGEGEGSAVRPGAVYLYKGTWGSGLVPWKLVRESDFGSATPRDGDRFGASLAAIDGNGDGFADLFIGAPRYQTSAGVEAGAVFYCFGTHLGPAASGGGMLTQSDDTPTETDENGDRFGAALAVLPVDSGGFSCLAVGVPRERPGSNPRSGLVMIFEIQQTSVVYREGFTDDDPAFGVAPANGDRFGEALASGDFDGDGVSDLAVGAPQTDVATGAGSVYLFRGAVGHMVAAERKQTGASAAGDRYGDALAAGNLDGTGPDELIVGAPGRKSSGRVLTYRNGAGVGAIQMARIQTLSEALIPGETAAAGDSFGAALAAGDFDHDGKADLAVGVPFRDGVNSNSGGVDLFLADAAGTGTLAGHGVIARGGAAAKYGTSVAIGQFNGGGNLEAAAGIPGRDSGAGGLSEILTATVIEYRFFSQATHTLR